MKRWLFILALALAVARGDGRVIVISVDGLRPDAVTTLGPELAPNFHRLRREGAFTDNARTDYHYTTTLPNHTCMITSRPVLGPCGHGLIVNFGGLATNLHAQGYKASMFDVAHDHGLSTALFAGKSKFLSFQGSYAETTGAPDLTGEDNGRNKLDFVLVDGLEETLVTTLAENLPEKRWDLVMLHFRTPDSGGHGYDWNLDPGSEYLATIVRVDGYLGRIFAMLDAQVETLGKVHLILTTDHGGTRGTRTHVYPEVPTNYTIPFYVSGPGVKAGGDLYELNPELVDPGTLRPELNSPTRPVRNSMVGNLALQLLGLPAIPGSCVNLSQQFRIDDPLDFSALYPGLDRDGDANGNGLSNFADYALGADPAGLSRPDLLPKMEGRNLIVNQRANCADLSLGIEISADGRTWGPLLEGATFLRTASEETLAGVRHTLQVPTLGSRIFYRQVFQ